MPTVSVIYDLIGRDNASPAFDKAGQSATRLESTVSRVGKAVVAAGAAIAAGAVAIGVESVKAAVQFQSSMERIHTQAGASQKAVESLTSSVLKLAPSTEQGPQQLADALYHLKSVGMDNADAMKALKTASDLAAVGGANLEDTTNALAGAWRSGIKGAQTFGETAATVNAIIGAGNMKMEDLVSAIGTGILPAAKTFGVSLKSVGAALALMTDEGVPAEDAATRLRMSLSLLGAPSQQSEKYLKSIGLTGLDLANALRSPGGLVSAISLLKQHLDASGLSASKQAQILSRAFGGGQSSSAILTMVNNLSVLQKKQDQINTSIGKYGSSVTAQRQTAQAQFDLLKSSVDTLGIRLGLDLLPPVTSFVSFLAKTGVPAVAGFASKVAGLIPVDRIKKDAKAVEQFIGGLFGTKPAATTPSPTFGAEQINRARPMGSAVAPVSAAASLGQQFASALKKADWGTILGDAIKGAVSGAQKIGAGIIDLIGKINWTSLGKGLAGAAVGLAVGLVDNLPNALISETIHHPLDMLLFVASLFPAGKLLSALGKVFEGIPIVGKLFSVFGGALEKAGKPIWTLFGKLLRLVFGDAADRILGYFAKAGSWLVGKGESILLGLMYGAEDGARFLTRWLSKIEDFVLAPFKKAGSWLVDKGGDILSGLWSGAKDVWNGTVSKWLAKIYGWVLSYFAKASNWLYGKGQDVLTGLWKGAQWVWTSTGRWIGSLGSKIIGYFAKAGSWLYGHGGDIISGLKNGIVDALKDIGSWVKAHVVDPVVNWVKHWFGIHSPSTVMAWIGGHLMGGLFQGMMSHDIESMVKMIFGSLPAALGAIVGKGLISLTDLPGKALDALGNLGSKALSLLGSLFGGGGSANGSNQAIGKAMAAALGWTGAQWTALQQLWTRESGWSTTARNPSSGAYGIPQSLPASKMASAGADWLTNPATQIKWGLSYIAGRYGTPASAWAHEVAAGWYGHGGRFAAGQLIGVGERGPELVSFDQPGRVLSPEERDALYSAASRGSDGGDFTGTLYLDSGELLGIVRGEIRRDEKETLRAARSGSGRRR